MKGSELRVAHPRSSSLRGRKGDNDDLGGTATVLQDLAPRTSGKPFSAVLLHRGKSRFSVIGEGLRVSRDDLDDCVMGHSILHVPTIGQGCLCEN